MEHRGRNNYAVSGIAMLPIEVDTTHPGCHTCRFELQSIKHGKPLDMLVYWRVNLKP